MHEVAGAGARGKQAAQITECFRRLPSSAIQYNTSSPTILAPLFIHAPSPHHTPNESRNPSTDRLLYFDTLQDVPRPRAVIMVSIPPVESLIIVVTS